MYMFTSKNLYVLSETEQFLIFVFIFCEPPKNFMVGDVHFLIDGFEVFRIIVNEILWCSTNGQGRCVP